MVLQFKFVHHRRSLQKQSFMVSMKINRLDCDRHEGRRSLSSVFSCFSFVQCLIFYFYSKGFLAIMNLLESMLCKDLFCEDWRMFYIGYSWYHIMYNSYCLDSFLYKMMSWFTRLHRGKKKKLRTWVSTWCQCSDCC